MGHCSTISRLRSLEMDPLVSRKVSHPLRSRLLELKSPDDFTRTFRGHESIGTPPIATAFSTQALGGCLLGIADEEGQVTLLDSRKKFGNLDSAGNSGGDGKYAHTYEIHKNAIFDFMWLYDDLSFATVSGDGSAKITAVRDGEALGTLVGHSGSVKTIRSMPMNPHTLSTAGRDGNIMIWDLRVHQERVLKPVVRVRGAHSFDSRDLAKRWVSELCRHSSGCGRLSSTYAFSSPTTLHYLGNSDPVVLLQRAVSLRLFFSMKKLCSAVVLRMGVSWLGT